MSYVYIGKKDCGCVPCIVADDEHKKEIAEDVADWIQRGLTIERVTSEVGRNLFGRCDKHKEGV